MRVALVHDYLNEFGGAERVLLTLAEMYPGAPIYTAFYKPGSLAHERFADRKIVTSWAHKIPGFAGKLHSPLRFLAPLIWESFNLDKFDVVISSASWYITKGVITRPETLHVCYCHTPPRYLYGYPTSVEWKKWWLVRQYANIVNPPLREYDFLAAQRVDEFVTNSVNTASRIEKYYRRKAEIIYPPVELPDPGRVKRGDYYLVISRLVGGKGLGLVVEAANRLRAPLKVVGVPAGWSKEYERLRETAGGTVEFLGYQEDGELAKLYAGAKAFLALAEDEDFGITPVESMICGTPVLAYRGGGYVETVVEGRTGVFVDELTSEAVVEGLEKLEKMKITREVCIKRGRKYRKEVFEKKMRKFVEEKYKNLSTR